MLCCVVLCCVALRCVALRCVALQCTALHCIALHCIVLYCIVTEYNTIIVNNNKYRAYVHHIICLTEPTTPISYQALFKITHPSLEMRGVRNLLCFLYMPQLPRRQCRSISEHTFLIIFRQPVFNVMAGKSSCMHTSRAYISKLGLHAACGRRAYTLSECRHRGPTA